VRTLPPKSLLAAALLAALPAAAPAAPAPAGSVSLAPNTERAASRVRLDARGEAAGLRQGELPRGVALAFQRGFAFDRRAVSAYCTRDQASRYDCPTRSRVGSGTIEAVIRGPFPGMNSERVVDIALFAGRATASGEVIRVVFQLRDRESGNRGTATGRLISRRDGAYGAHLELGRLPVPTLPPGTSATLERVTLDVFAKRTIRRTTKTRCRSRPSKRCTRTRTRTYTVIRNPRSCAGRWALRLRVTYANGEEVREATAPCSQS
jgi:hypothetical protein